MLVSDGGTVIRVPVHNIRIASRATKGVTIFNTAEGEKVVSVERISEPQRRGRSAKRLPQRAAKLRPRAEALGRQVTPPQREPKPRNVLLFSLRRMRSVS